VAGRVVDRLLPPFFPFLAAHFFFLISILWRATKPTGSPSFPSLLRDGRAQWSRFQMATFSFSHSFSFSIGVGCGMQMETSLSSQVRSDAD